MNEKQNDSETVRVENSPKRPVGLLRRIRTFFCEQELFCWWEKKYDNIFCGNYRLTKTCKICKQVVIRQHYYTNSEGV
jgi:hypothetical protein